MSDHTHQLARRVLLAGCCLVAAGSLAACSSGSSGDDASFSDVDVSAPGSALSTQLREAGFSSFASALDVVDIDQLIDTPEFTLLVPSDQAFQSMSAEEMGDLLADPESLLGVLRNHVVGERLDAAQLAEVDSIRTEADLDLDVSSDDGVLTIGGASVLSSDLEIDDGIVHSVDRIFVP